MTEKELRQFVEDYVKAINSNNIDAIERYHAPGSAALSEGAPGEKLGAAERRKYFEERIRAFPDAKMTVNKIQPDPSGNRVTFEWTIRGTHKGPFKGMEPTGQQVEQHGSSELELSKGKIVHEVSHQDLSAFQEHLAKGK